MVVAFGYPPCLPGQGADISSLSLTPPPFPTGRDASTGMQPRKLGDPSATFGGKVGFPGAMAWMAIRSPMLTRFPSPPPMLLMQSRCMATRKASTPTIRLGGRECLVVRGACPYGPWPSLRAGLQAGIFPEVDGGKPGEFGWGGIIIPNSFISGLPLSCIGAWD